MSNRDRDLEITRRREAGELPADLARAYGVSPERVWQIVTAVQRHQRGEPPQQRRRYPANTAAPARPVVRPRLRLWPDRPAGSEWYECVGAGRMGVGATKLEAYARWQSAGPVATSATDASTQTRTAACVPVERQPDPTLAQPALTPVHASQVQVLPGVTTRKPLRMTAMLGLNAERIGAQPPMHSMHGGSRARSGGFHDQE
ncbi:hypothetical protein U2261_19045 [Achromobacter xylosoxidans]|uniref:hypothetical protein n=1 Tax=Alcaligenes xylosoxydans xylosoxydans TaxID=85698 RepID=UPI002ACA09AF|nr:hypothetical protein [Achromobacter xylosoxidans]MDZ5616719.1 hypothetical protein [Achromobacter xylosoxidans]MDZ5626121.1 hypothetical protein [Achromobacter xylosoxidans]MDZ5686879.1 hypothetical protein [Achromobacter xylosoxidans]